MMAASTSTRQDARSRGTKPPVVIVRDNSPYKFGRGSDSRERKRVKTIASGGGDDAGRGQRRAPPLGSGVLHPGSDSLLDDMLRPLPREEFLDRHFRKNAVHISRRRRGRPDGRGDAMVSDICDNHLFGLDSRRMFVETSSESVFLWLRRPLPSDTFSSNGNSAPRTATLDSVDIPDPETAYALHASGGHPAYCRAPPGLERQLVGPLLRATGMGGGHYHPPHADAEAVSLGGGTTLGRGEVELFIGAPSSIRSYSSINVDDTSENGIASRGKQHMTGWHTDFQENFTIQLSGVKRWTLRRGRVRHPLRGTTPHYVRDASVVEDQMKASRLSCMAGCPGFDGVYGFEYGDNNAFGPEQTVTLHPGDVLYFPAGMWHRVETIETGVSLNASLMGTTYATLVSRALEHLMVGSGDDGWREIVTCRPGGDDDGTQRLRGLLDGLGRLVDDFVAKGGGAQSVLSPALCHPPLVREEEEMASENEIDEGCDSAGEEDQSCAGEMKCAMDDQAKDSNEVEEEDDDEASLFGIVIPMDSFKGPPGWTCTKPPGAKIIKNPLATLIAMSDIVGRRQKRPRNSDDDGEDETDRKGTTEQYVLNVNYAGSEMMESHIRVILETSDPKTIRLLDRCLAGGHECGHGDGDENSSDDVNLNAGLASLPCLFYYGYLLWSCAM